MNIEFANPCPFVRLIAQAALSQGCISEGKIERVMAHPKGSR